MLNNLTITTACTMSVAGQGAAFKIGDTVLPTSVFYYPLLSSGFATDGGVAPPTPTTLSNIQVQSGASIPDGYIPAYSAASGFFVPTAPQGLSEIAYAANVTAATTAVAAPGGGGVGTSVDIPGAVISVAPSNNRPVWLQFGFNWQQTALGTGIIMCGFREVGGLGVSYSDIKGLPNSITTPLGFGASKAEFRLGAVTTTRIFQLTGLIWSPSAQAPTANILNASGNPSYIQAVAG